MKTGFDMEASYWTNICQQPHLQAKSEPEFISDHKGNENNSACPTQGCTCIQEVLFHRSDQGLWPTIDSVCNLTQPMISYNMLLPGYVPNNK